MKIRLCAIGFGNRTRKYLRYVAAHPDEVELCAAVDTDQDRLDEAISVFGLRKECCFLSVDEFMDSGIGVDAAIVATSDGSHYEIGSKVIAHGCHLLLEKPMAATAAQCIGLVREAENAGIVSGLCYVMRYHPYYRRIKEIVDSGMLGRIVSIRHREVVGIDRMTHTFVRGNWSREEDSSPIFISKCCHDVDFLMWLTGISAGPGLLETCSIGSEAAKSGHGGLLDRSGIYVSSSTGSLSRYCAESAPEGAAYRCVDCPLEKGCRYSAVDLYRRRREWIGNFRAGNAGTLDGTIERELDSGRFGRCVFHCDNDVLDYQEAELVLPGGIRLSIELDGISDGDGRETVIEFWKGRLIARDSSIHICFAGSGNAPDGCGQWKTEDYSGVCAQPLHAGADLAIMQDFCHAIRTGSRMQCSLLDALPGSLACLAVEERRN